MPAFGKPDDAHIREQLQFQTQVQRFAPRRPSRQAVGTGSSRTRSMRCHARRCRRLRVLRFEPGVVRSASMRGVRESASQTCVPTGMRITTSAPSAPCFRADAPLRPLPARKRRWYLNASRVLMFSSHSAMTLPPRPPSPPSGPPRGTNFSRRPLITPSPPLPLLMWISTSSIIFRSYQS